MKPQNEKYNPDHPYRVPDGYFDSLTDQIIDGKNEYKDQKNWSPWHRTALAAIAIVVILIAIWFPSRDQNSKPRDLLSGISTEDLLLYLENEPIDEYELIREFELQIIEEMDAPQYLHDDIQVDDDILEMYDYKFEENLPNGI